MHTRLAECFKDWQFDVARSQHQRITLLGLAAFLTYFFIVLYLNRCSLAIFFFFFFFLVCCSPDERRTSYSINQFHGHKRVKVIPIAIWSWFLCDARILARIHTIQFFVSSWNSCGNRRRKKSHHATIRRREEKKTHQTNSNTAKTNEKSIPCSMIAVFIVFKLHIFIYRYFTSEVGWIPKSHLFVLNVYPFFLSLSVVSILPHKA